MKRRDLLKLAAALPFLKTSEIFGNTTDENIKLTVIEAEKEDILPGYVSSIGCDDYDNVVIIDMYMIAMKDMETNNDRMYLVPICVEKTDLQKSLKSMQECNKNELNGNDHYIVVHYGDKCGLISFNSSVEKIC